MNPQDKTQAAPEAESFRLHSLEAELARLKASLEKENRGVVGWSKRWGCSAPICGNIIRTRFWRKSAMRGVKPRRGISKLASGSRCESPNTWSRY